MTVLVVDTHALVWWVAAPRRLSAKVRRALSEADSIGIPVIVFWEVALLARRGRVTLGGTPEEWTALVLSLPRVECLPLTCAVATLAESLAMRADPADRFIVATAMSRDVPLVTRDRALRDLRVVETLW